MPSRANVVRKDARTNRRLILSFLDVPRSACEIATLTGLNAATVRQHLVFLHESWRIHIASWVRRRNRPMRVWAVGPGRDAPPLPPIPDKERAARAHHLRTVDPERAVARKAELHANYLKRRAPRADPAAAWFLGASK